MALRCTRQNRDIQPSYCPAPYQRSLVAAVVVVVVALLTHVLPGPVQAFFEDRLLTWAQIAVPLETPLQVTDLPLLALETPGLPGCQFTTIDAGWCSW
jgi:hypothetical protein